MKIKRVSPYSGKENERDIDVTEEQLQQWIDGLPIQEAMPHLSSSDREFLITGLLDEEWDAITKSFEE